MCAPTKLPALAGDQSWRPDHPSLDPGRAFDQWQVLRALVEQHIAPVVEATAAPWASAMTFTRDLAVLVDDRLIPLEPHVRRGAFERPLFERSMAELGIELVTVESPIGIDGGTILADRAGRLLIGTPNDTDERVTADARRLETLTGRPTYRVPVAGGRFPHLDMALCDLGSSWLVYPGGLGGYDRSNPAWRELLGDRPIIEVSPDDGERLACNLVVGDGVAIGPPIGVGLRGRIEATGVRYVATPLDELAKAGGGAHCLTLELPASRA